MTSKWNEYKLKDVCIKITDGSHYSPKATELGYPMLSVKDMQEFGFSYTNCKYITEQDFVKMQQNDCVPLENDILVAKDGSYLKHIFICKKNKQEAILSSIALFRPNTKIINPNFLCYLLKSPNIYNYIKLNCVSGSALPRIILKDFKNITIDIPPLETQQKIAKVLSAIDDKIELNNSINNNLEQQAQAIFNNKFVNLETVPSNWQIGNLSDIADYLNGLAMQKFRPSEDEIGIPVLKIKELRQGFCDNQSDLCSPNIKSEYLINNGDVIFSWSGTLWLDLWCSGLCGLNQHLFKVTSLKYDKWFYYFWTKYHMNKFIAIATDKATTMGHIKREDLDKSEVLIPDNKTYKQLNSILSPLINLIIKNRVENRQLIQLRDSLLPKLMSGEIDVSKVEIDDILENQSTDKLLFSED